MYNYEHHGIHTHSILICTLLYADYDEDGDDMEYDEEYDDEGEEGHHIAGDDEPQESGEEEGEN